MSIESKVTGLASKVHRRLSGRWRRHPAAPAETHDLVQKTARQRRPPLPEPVVPRLFRPGLVGLRRVPSGAERSARGVHRRLPRCPDSVAHVKAFASIDGRVFSTPVPVDDWFHAETIEYVGLLKSVLTATERYVALELGAGWGPWLISGATAARRRGIKDIRLHGVEGDPEHFASMQTHFRDNGFDPAAYRLDNAAIGVKAGRARWPKRLTRAATSLCARSPAPARTGTSRGTRKAPTTGGRVSTSTSTSRCCRSTASSSESRSGTSFTSTCRAPRPSSVQPRPRS